MLFWRSVVGKLWITIIGLVAIVLSILGLFLLEYIDNYFQDSYAVKRLFAYTAIIGFLLTTFFTFFLSSKITQPLREMKKAANLITRGEYRTRVHYRSSDEIGELANSFNHMADELEVTLRDLNHEKEHLSGILRSMTDAVITFDAEGRVIQANPQGEKIIEKWSGIKWSDVNDPSEVTLTAAQTVLSTVKTQAVGNPNADGAPTENVRTIPEPLLPLFEMSVEGNKELMSKIQVLGGVWSVMMAPLYANDQVRGVVTVMREMTEEYRLNKMRTDFLENVSHDLRTPLSLLQGYSEALLDDIAGTAEERRELAKVIHDETLRMGRLVEDLLDLAGMESGQLKLSIEQLQIRSFIERVQRKFFTLAKDKGIALRLKIESEVSTIEADEDRLEQVLTNLLDNAIRHTSGNAVIELRVRFGELGGYPALLVDVADQGRGIPEEDLPYLFERFYKANKARTRGNTGGGTGLGLAIVKNIIEAHDGLITVQSTVGVGTVFTIVLPLKPFDE